MMTLSVIIPVFNTERFLSRCIESVLNQSFTDFELLLIDDGSKDGSGLICDSFAEKDNRVRVFHKKNGGVSSARNLGLDNAKGKWVTFVDSDDWIEQDYFLIPFVEDIDLYVQNMVFADGKQEECFECATITQKEFGSYIENNINSHMFRTACGFFFKRKVLSDNGIRFDVSVRLGEDTLFVMDYYRYIGTIQIMGNSRYVYNQQEDWNDKFVLSWTEAEYFLKEFMNKYEALSIKANKLLSWMFLFIYNLVSKEEKNLDVKWALSDPVLRYKKTLFPQRGLMFKLKYFVARCVSYLKRRKT